MSALPKISIITVVRNDVKNLPRAIASLRAQDYPNLEYIVMDGGSIDGTVDVIKANLDIVTIWESKPDGGPSNAFNKGIKVTTGDFVTLLNSDDILPPGTLQAVAQAAQVHPQADIISGGSEVLYADGSKRVFNDTKQVDFSLEAALAGLTLFNSRYYRPELLAKHDALREMNDELRTQFPGKRFFMAGDREFLIRLAVTNTPGVTVPKILYTYYSHDESITFGGVNRIGTQLENLWICQKIRRDHLLNKEQKQLLDAWEAEVMVAILIYAAQARKLAASVALVAFYVLRHPLRFAVAFSKLGARFMRNRFPK